MDYHCHDLLGWCIYEHGCSDQWCRIVSHSFLFGVGRGGKDLIWAIFLENACIHSQACELTFAFLLFSRRVTLLALFTYVAYLSIKAQDISGIGTSFLTYLSHLVTTGN